MRVSSKKLRPIQRHTNQNSKHRQEIGSGLFP
jgi:hypothetical protein